MRTARPILCFAAFPALQRTIEFGAIARGHVNRARRSDAAAAGKAVNAARAVRALGGDALVTGLNGGATGRDVARALRAEGIAFRFVATAHPTRICQTLLETDAGRATELVEEARPPSAAEWARLLEAAVRLGRRAGFVVASGTLPPGAPADFYARLLRALGRDGPRVLLDTHGAPLRRALPCGPFLAKPNRGELERTLGRPLRAAADVRRAARALCARGAVHALVTDGGRPAWFTDGRRTWRLDPPPVRALNPIGAGDALAGAWAWAVQRGADAAEAARFAVGAATASCLARGPAEFRAAEARRWAGEVRTREVRGEG